MSGQLPCLEDEGGTANPNAMIQTFDANEKFTFAPLPPLHDPTQEEASARLARSLSSPGWQNPWNVRISRMPVDATIVRPVTAIRSVKPVQRHFQLTGVSGRSPFRKGEMALDNDGFTLTGLRVEPARWPTIVGNVGAGIWLAALACLLIPFVESSHLFFTEMSVTASVGGFVIAILGAIVESILTERRLVPAEIRVSWEDVNEIQFASRLHWAVLVYRGPASKNSRRSQLLALPLNALEPTVIHALQEAAESYVPGKCRPNADVYRWTPFRRLVAASVIGVLAFGFFLLYLVMH